MTNSFIVKAFSFTNKSGGTGLWREGVNNEFDPPFKGTAIVTVDSEFHDYETGRRLIGTAKSPALQEYMRNNAHPQDQRVFFSGFDIVKEEVTKDELTDALEQLYLATVRGVKHGTDLRLKVARKLLVALGRTVE
jgi:hypothetical protein